MIDRYTERGSACIENGRSSNVNPFMDVYGMSNQSIATFDFVFCWWGIVFGGLSMMSLFNPSVPDDWTVTVSLRTAVGLYWTCYSWWFQIEVMRNLAASVHWHNWIFVCFAIMSSIRWHDTRIDSSDWWQHVITYYSEAIRWDLSRHSWILLLLSLTAHLRDSDPK